MIEKKNKIEKKEKRKKEKKKILNEEIQNSKSFYKLLKKIVI